MSMHPLEKSRLNGRTERALGVKSAKRIRRAPADAKLLILRTAERIMRDEGYAAVTVRHVAKVAGVSSTLLHYYYPTADDLLVALYRQRRRRISNSFIGRWSQRIQLWRFGYTRRI